MPSVGTGVVEIRVRDSDGAFRLFYVAKFAEAIYVLHAPLKGGSPVSLSSASAPSACNSDCASSVRLLGAQILRSTEAQASLRHACTTRAGHRERNANRLVDGELLFTLEAVATAKRRAQAHADIVGVAHCRVTGPSC